MLVLSCRTPVEDTQLWPLRIPSVAAHTDGFVPEYAVRAYRSPLSPFSPLSPLKTMLALRMSCFSVVSRHSGLHGSRAASLLYACLTAVSTSTDTTLGSLLELNIYATLLFAGFLLYHFVGCGYQTLLNLFSPHLTFRKCHTNGHVSQPR